MTRVADLAGAELSYWVAQIDPARKGIRWQRERDHWIGFGRIGSSPEFPCWLIMNADKSEREKLRGYLRAKVYAPHEDWAQGGPLIPVGGVSMCGNLGESHSFSFTGVDKKIGHGDGP